MNREQRFMATGLSAFALALFGLLIASDRFLDIRVAMPIGIVTLICSVIPLHSLWIEFKRTRIQI